MPWWVETVFLQWLPWILMMERPGFTFSYTSIRMESKIKELERGDKMPRNLVPDLLDKTEDFLAGNLANTNLPLYGQQDHSQIKPTPGVVSPLSKISPSDSQLSLPTLATLGKNVGAKDTVNSHSALGQSIKVEAARPATSLLEKDLQEYIKI